MLQKFFPPMKTFFDKVTGCAEVSQTVSLTDLVFLFLESLDFAQLCHTESIIHDETGFFRIYCSFFCWSYCSWGYALSTNTSLRYHTHTLEFNFSFFRFLNFRAFFVKLDNITKLDKYRAIFTCTFYFFL